MLSKQEIKKWLLENCVDAYGDLDLSNLEFSDFEGDICIDGWVVKNDLLRDNCYVGGDLWQGNTVVKNSLFQEGQTVGKDLLQDKQRAGGHIYNRDSIVSGESLQIF